VKIKKILLTGSSGFVGKNILSSNILDGFETLTPSSQDLNLLDKKLVEKYLKVNGEILQLLNQSRNGKNTLKELEFLLEKDQK